MITWKMTCMIQSILPSHCLCNVNLGNYIGLPYALKTITPQCAFTLDNQNFNFMHDE